MEASIPSGSFPPLHTVEYMHRIPINRVFAAVYMCAILALLYRHALTILNSTTLGSLFISISLMTSDCVLAFMWVATQSFHMRPVRRRRVFLENLDKKEDDFPALDVFICTADPYKEPPMSVVNTALSVMAYDYPTNKISVYVSDDGGSELTLFALMEAAKFATHWLPFCRKNNILQRCPEAYFRSSYASSSSQTADIQLIYESLKTRVEKVVERGKVCYEYINGEQESDAFKEWRKKNFTRQDHPAVIQVLLQSGKDKDISGHLMPNLIYVSREKSSTSHHHFKAGALNVLVRVSAAMTNAPMILTLDCDMYSNDPRTPRHVLCYIFDTTLNQKLGFLQFPQRFPGLNKNDIYASELKRLFFINPMGMDGLAGTSYVGTGCFFLRRVFFGGPLHLESPEISELGPNHEVNKPIRSQQILALANKVAGCNYENQTNWGTKIGFRYGSLVEDYYTGYMLHCEGWKSVYCNPKREAFLGDIPINLYDVLNQNKRWSVGLLEVGFSKYSPATFGIKNMGLLMGLAYAHYAFWPIWSLPITIYAFIPSLALLQKVSIFPKVSDPWFLLYIFLFLGSYIQDFLEFILAGSTWGRWWSDQRMWMIRGVSSYLFGSIEFILNTLGMPMHGFNLTNKVVDEEQSIKYDKGMFEFGVSSPMFVPLTMAGIINLVSFIHGIMNVFSDGDLVEIQFLQTFLIGFVVVNCWPIYKAILRTDKGKMPTKITIISTFLAWVVYKVSYLIHGSSI